MRSPHFPPPIPQGRMRRTGSLIRVVKRKTHNYKHFHSTNILLQSLNLSNVSAHICSYIICSSLYITGKKEYFLYIVFSLLLKNNIELTVSSNKQNILTSDRSTMDLLSLSLYDEELFSSAPISLHLSRRQGPEDKGSTVGPETQESMDCTVRHTSTRTYSRQYSFHLIPVLCSYMQALL